MIRWIAKRLRYAADRLDPHGAPRHTGLTFRFQEKKGIVFKWGGHGCPVYILRDFPNEVWYLNRLDYERAHDEQD